MTTPPTPQPQERELHGIKYKQFLTPSPRQNMAGGIIHQPADSIATVVSPASVMVPDTHPTTPLSSGGFPSDEEGTPGAAESSPNQDSPQQLASTEASSLLPGQEEARPVKKAPPDEVALPSREEESTAPVIEASSLLPEPEEATPIKKTPPDEVLQAKEAPPSREEESTAPVREATDILPDEEATDEKQMRALERRLLELQVKKEEMALKKEEMAVAQQAVQLQEAKERLRANNQKNKTEDDDIEVVCVKVEGRGDDDDDDDDDEDKKEDDDDDEDEEATKPAAKPSKRVAFKKGTKEDDGDDKDEEATKPARRTSERVANKKGKKDGTEPQDGNDMFPCPGKTSEGKGCIMCKGPPDPQWCQNCEKNALDRGYKYPDGK